MNYSGNNPPRPLRLALMGYNWELSKKGLRQLVENNKGQVGQFNESKFRSVAYLNDDTTITAIGPGQDFRGHKYDQLILFDDDRWHILQDKAAAIQAVIEQTLYMSYVPEEFQIIKYEDVGEV